MKNCAPATYRIFIYSIMRNAVFSQNCTTLSLATMTNLGEQVLNYRTLRRLSRPKDFEFKILSDVYTDRIITYGRLSVAQR